MKSLQVYPTSRAIRAVSTRLKEQDGLLPTLMRMDEFEHRAVLVNDKALIDSINRIRYLKKAAQFEDFTKLKTDIELVKFFTKSDAIFKFLEELSAEGISFDTLMEADAYAEFAEHISILEMLKKNYKKLLDTDNLTDKMFTPDEYKINIGFVSSYKSIELHLEGYLSHYEMNLLEDVSRHTKLYIIYTTSKFNKKMQERFALHGIEIPNDAHNVFNFSTKEIISSTKVDDNINPSIYAVEERSEQIALAFAKIEELVSSNIDPKDIALILPDEALKEHFGVYDTHNNLNFAMGFDMSSSKYYKQLDALYLYWQKPEPKHKLMLEKSSINLKYIEDIQAGKQCTVEEFFDTITHLELSKNRIRTQEQIDIKMSSLMHIFKAENLSTKEWLFIWLKVVSEIKIDDVRGGLVTVMGVLETRGVTFDAVVIVDFNDTIVPAKSSKDRFLNSVVRRFANLPTIDDREALQKQYYKRLLEQSNQAIIIYSTSDNKLPSKFLFELGLDDVLPLNPPNKLLFPQASLIVQMDDPIVEDFDARAIKWSASRLKVYIDCKRKYYYRYTQKIKAKSDDELNEGLFLHAVFDELYSKQSHYTQAIDIQKAMDKIIDEKMPYQNSSTEYKKLLWREKLKDFVESQIEHFQAGWRVAYREYEITGDIGGLSFAGRIDRIDQDDQRTLVIDYKSGTVAKEPKSLNPDKISDFQMSIYQSMLESKFQNISLAYWKIFDSSQIQEVTLLEERRELLHEHIINLKQTNSFIASKCEDLQKCRYCEFALMCERGQYL